MGSLFRRRCESQSAARPKGQSAVLALTLSCAQTVAPVGAGLLGALPGEASASASLEPADVEATVLVAPLEVEGELSKQEIDKVEAELLSGLERAGLSLIRPDEVEPGEASLPCGDSVGCIVKLAKANAATHVLQVTIVQSGRDYELQMVLSSGVNGSTQARSNQQCEICGLKELGELIGDQGAALQPKLEAVPATLVIDSAPQGATVRIDGKLVGVTPIVEPIGAGEHVVTVEMPGYVRRERRITVVSGGEETISVGLQAVPQVEGDDEPDGRGLRIAGWTALGIGVGLMAGGATMLALDGRPVPSRCSDDANIDINGLCRYRYDTLTGGAALAAVGGAALITAAVLVGIGFKRKKDKGADSNKAAVVPTGNGLIVRF